MADGSIIIDTKIDDKEFKKSIKTFEGTMKNASKRTETFGKSMIKGVTLPIAGAAAGLVAMVLKLGDYADSVLDASDATGLSVEEIQRYEHVAKIAGTSTDVMTDAAGKLNKQWSAIQDGSGKSATAIEGLGLEISDLDQMDMDTRLNTLVGALADIEDPVDRAIAGTDIFGNQWETMAPIIGMGTDQINELKDGYAGVMTEEDLKKANDFRIAWVELKDEMLIMVRSMASDLIPIFQDVLLPMIQDQLIPVVQNFAEKIGELITWFDGLDDNVKKNIITAILLLAALGPIILVVSKVIAVVAFLGKTFLIVVKIVAIITKVFALFLNPIGWIVLAVAALAFVFFKYWAEIRDFTIKVFSAIGDFMVNLWNSIKDTVSKVIGILKSAFQKQFDAIKNTVTNVFNAIKKVVNGVMQSVKSIIDTVMGVVTSGWNKAWEGMKNVVAGIANVIGGIVNGIIGAIENMVNALAGAVNSLPSFSIPNWVPVIGGGEFGIPNIPKVSLPKIPKLDIGTDRVNTDGLAMIHKGESVVPANVAGGGYSGGSGVTVIVELDGRQIAKGTAPHMVDMIRLKTGMVT